MNLGASGICRNAVPFGEHWRGSTRKGDCGSPASPTGWAKLRVNSGSCAQGSVFADTGGPGIDWQGETAAANREANAIVSAFISSLRRHCPWFAIEYRFSCGDKFHKISVAVCDQQLVPSRRSRIHGCLRQCGVACDPSIQTPPAKRVKTGISRAATRDGNGSEIGIWRPYLSVYRALRASSKMGACHSPRSPRRPGSPHSK